VPGPGHLVVEDHRKTTAADGSTNGRAAWGCAGRGAGLRRGRRQVVVDGDVELGFCRSRRTRSHEPAVAARDCDLVPARPPAAGAEGGQKMQVCTRGSRGGGLQVKGLHLIGTRWTTTGERSMTSAEDQEPGKIYNDQDGSVQSFGNGGKHADSSRVGERRAGAVRR